MRIALVSDIHGNGPALEAVLADIRRQTVDTLICLGDVATLGPQPRKVITALRDAGAACILGNHDATLLDLGKAEEYQIAPLLHPSLRWCADQLTPDDFDFLRSFQPRLDLDLDPVTRLTCFHGSPRSNTEVLLPTTPPEMLDEIFGQESATVLAGGHSHIQMLRQHKGRLIVNPGSVGNAFRLPFQPKTNPSLLPWAEYGILNLADGILSMDLKRVPFDLAAFKRIAAESSLPRREWWIEQYASV